MRLWQDVEWMKRKDEEREVMLQEAEAGSCRTRCRQSSSSAGPVKRDLVAGTMGAGSLNQRSSSARTRSLRGRLGHLVDALTDAQMASCSTTPAPPPSPTQTQAWTTSPPPPHSDRDNSYANVTVSMCSLCDRMFCSEQELTAHEQHCMA